MQKSRFTEAQMVRVLREADSSPVSEVAKKHGGSEQTIYSWCKRYGALDVTAVRYLKQLEQENVRLKKLLAERDLAIERGVSQRRACQLFAVARSTLSYQSKMVAKDAPLVEALRRLSAQYPRFGSRRSQVIVAREGFEMSAARTYRLWHKAKLQVPKHRRGRRAAVSRPRPKAPMEPHHVWAYAFVYARCANGQVLKCLTIIAEYTRQCLSIAVAGRIRSRRVIDELTRLVSLHGAPKYLRSDNGPEFVSRAILRWLAGQEIETAYSDPGKPWQNGMDESFNGKFRDECLHTEWFRSRAEARVVIEKWRRAYNDVRPHSSLKSMTPNEFSNQLPLEATQPPSSRT